MPPKYKSKKSTMTKTKKSMSKNKETKATKAKISKGTAELGGKKISLERIAKIPDGQSFKFHSDTIKMSKQIHKQLVLGLNLMKKR